MTEIFQAIDSYTADYLSDYTTKLWGFSELMKKSAKGADQPMPVTIDGRHQVSLDDRYQVVTWMRLIERVNYEGNAEWSFGKNEARFATLPIRLVFANKVELGENLVFEFVQNLPSKLIVPDYQFVFISATQGVDPDHETIYTTELGNTVYERHRFPWNLYAINLNVEFILCDGNYRVTNEGDFRVTA